MGVGLTACRREDASHAKACEGKRPDCDGHVNARTAVKPRLDRE
jgi:hypothetical protein